MGGKGNLKGNQGPQFSGSTLAAGRAALAAGQSPLPPFTSLLQQLTSPRSSSADD